MASKSSNELRLGSNGKYPLNGGLCLNEESSIDFSQASSLLNMTYDDGGLPIKRQGQSYLFNTSLGDGGINGIYPNYKGKTIIAWSSKLFTQEGSSQPVEIYSGLANSRAFFFVYNGILYMMNGTNYIQYNGTTVSGVDPYKPQISINRKPDGSQSTVHESWNMLGSGFIDSFNGDGTTGTYKLSLTYLDNTPVTATVNGTLLTEGANFTIDRNTGIVSFGAPPAAGTNNVLITAYKSQSTLVSNILKCTTGIEFSNRMFLAGNPDLPNFYFAGGLTNSIDATYFPEKYKYAIRGADKAVTGFQVQYNKLIVFKEDLICTVEASLGLDNTASFPISYLNTEVGCDIPNSIQLINNNPVFANTYGGVYVIVSTLVPGEKNVLNISQNINGSTERRGLLQEDLATLKEATSVDHNNKYYLCVGSNCYVLDYKQSFAVNKPNSLVWLYFTNINARNWLIRDNELMYGHRTEGKVIRFITAANDFGSAIQGLWKSKLMDFDKPEYEKMVSDVWFTTRANNNSNITINFYNDQQTLLESSTIPSTELTSFKWSSFTFGGFTWDVQTFSPTIRFRPKLKGIRYFQIELSNNVYNENLSIISLVIKYNLTKRVR